MIEARLYGGHAQPQKKNMSQAYMTSQSEENNTPSSILFMEGNQADIWEKQPDVWPITKESLQNKKCILYMCQGYEQFIQRGIIFLFLFELFGGFLHDKEIKKKAKY